MDTRGGGTEQPPGAGRSAPGVETVDTEATPDRTRSRRRWPWAIAAVIVIGVAASVAYVWRRVSDKPAAKFYAVGYTVPDAPRLVALPGETVYRIDPTKSELRYEVQERVFGQGVRTATGATSGIAGDVAINRTEPAKSRTGIIRVDVKQLRSDNDLRDARLRASYLESYKFPYATLERARFIDMPTSVEDGKQYRFRLESTLKVKQTAAPVTWEVDASVAKGKLRATATTRVKMSTFGIGPISIVGFLSTGDDMTLTMTLTAVDPSKYTVPTEIAAPVEKPKNGKGPSFARAVMPILQANCASCHNRGQVGAASWKLDTAADVASTSDGLASVVRSGYMPPWPASTLGVPLSHSKRLDTATIDTLVQWSAAGGQLDVPPTTGITPTVGPQGTPPRQDVVMQPVQGYTGSLSVPNDYRCFVLDPRITKSVYMTGYTVTPGVTEEIHHVQVFHIDKAQVPDALTREGSDGKPGFQCYGSPTLGGGEGRRRHPTSTVPDSAGRKPMRNFSTQAGLVAGWVPGQDPAVFPEKSGILLQEGDAFVLQVHYHYDRAPVPDRTKLAIQVDPDDPSIKPLDVVNPIGPVEIPCMPGVKAPLCDRSAAIADDVRLYGPAGAFIEQGLLLLCGKTSDELVAQFKNGVARSSCVTTVPETGKLVAVLGHMHTLGKSFRFTLDPDTDRPTVLLDIPTWNFDWQMNYKLQTPIHVTAGQKIRMDCSWDRSLDPNRPPKYIVFAEGTEDEMCFGTYAIIPDNP